MRCGLDFYILFRRNLFFKGLTEMLATAVPAGSTILALSKYTTVHIKCNDIYSDLTWVRVQWTLTFSL
jgi:hypothetical protein